jgi:hypothetical protein
VEKKQKKNERAPIPPSPTPCSPANSPARPCCSSPLLGQARSSDRPGVSEGKKNATVTGISDFLTVGFAGERSEEAYRVRSTVEIRSGP